MRSISALARRAKSLRDQLEARNLPLQWLGRVRADVASALVPAEFWYGRYAHTFLERRPPHDGAKSELPEVIWCFWLGSNPLTENRRSGLAKLRELNPQADVRLVTPENLAEYVMPEHPLHPAYENLSVVHRSDYLRGYFLHHHGGGYSDVKTPVTSWHAAFDRLRASDKPILGTDIGSPKYASHLTGTLGVHVRRYYRRVLSCGTLIARSHTAFTGEWLREVERRLDYYAPALAEHPGDIWGMAPSYPIRWTGILADIVQPLCLKHLADIVYDDSVRFDETTPYR